MGRHRAHQVYPYLVLEFQSTWCMLKQDRGRTQIAESCNDILMSNKPIISVGDAALDYVYKICEFPPAPTKLQALKHITSGGGMAANAAATIAKLGGTIALWSRVGGDDAGAIIHQQLKRAGVDTTHVRALASARSPTAAVIVDQGGQRLVISEYDHALSLSANWLPVSDVAGAAVVLSDLNWLEGTETAFSAARAEGIPTVLDIDLGSGQLLPKVIGLTDYAIFSAPAFRTLRGRRRRPGTAGATYQFRRSPCRRDARCERLSLGQPTKSARLSGCVPRRNGRHHRRRRCFSRSIRLDTCFRGAGRRLCPDRIRSRSPQLSRAWRQSRTTHQRRVGRISALSQLRQSTYFVAPVTWHGHAFANAVKVPSGCSAAYAILR